MVGVGQTLASEIHTNEEKITQSFCHLLLPGSYVCVVIAIFFNSAKLSLTHSRCLMNVC